MRIEGASIVQANFNKPAEVKTEVKVQPQAYTQPQNQEVNKQQVSEKEIIKAIEGANKALVQHSTKLEFSIHEASKQIMVKVLNSETGEIIREIPNEKILDLVAKMVELAGIFVDERR